MEIKGRKLKILSAVVEIYIKTGQPAGSVSVCDFVGHLASPATVRGEMAELTLLGLLEQPHVSSGRIPSVAGLRVYVDHSMTRRKLSYKEKAVIDGVLCERVSDFESVLRETAKVLSAVTGCAVVFVAPISTGARVRNVKFVQISSRSAMLVMATSTGMVQNHLFTCKFNVTDEILDLFSKAVGEKLKGRSLVNLLPHSVGVVSDGRNTDFLIAPAFEAAIRAAKRAHLPQMGFEGQRNIFSLSKNSDDAVSLLEFLSDEESVSDLLFSFGGETRIFIGDEIGVPNLSRFSIVARRYSVGGRSGTIAAVGSTRLDYSGVTAKLEYAVRATENIFEEIVKI